MRQLSIFVLLILSSLTIAACGVAPAAAPEVQADILVTDAWVRPANPGMATMEHGAEEHGAHDAEEHGHGAHDAMNQDAEEHGAMEHGMGAGVTSAGYMVIRNTTGEPDFLVSAEADISNVIELHTVMMDGDVMRMRPVEKIEVPAGGEVELRPGGFHVMFIDVTRELQVGETVPLTLNFERAGAVEVSATIRQP